MRIAFVSLETSHHSDDPRARRIERVARLLSRRGHEVTLFCSRWWESPTDDYVEDGLRYRGSSRGTAPTSVVAQLPIHIARWNPDIVHTRLETSARVLSAHIGATLARAPTVLEWFGEDALADDWVTRFALGRPSRVVVPSELAQTALLEHGVQMDRTRVIPESIDFDQIDAAEVSDEVDIVWAHPLDEHANLDDLLLGLAELRDRDWQATIIGDGPRRAAFESNVSDMRIDDRVTFAGDCDRERRLELYRGAHVFVQTGTHGQFATELLWAMACGCVGIVEYQEHASAHELVETYPRGFMVTSPSEIAEAVAEAGELEHLRMADRLEEYDHDAVVQQYLDLYRSLL